MFKQKTITILKYQILICLDAKTLNKPDNYQVKHNGLRCKKPSVHSKTIPKTTQSTKGQMTTGVQ